MAALLTKKQGSLIGFHAHHYVNIIYPAIYLTIMRQIFCDEK
jgi:hypothetical protein